MSTILEALDAMYEVRAEADAAGYLKKRGDDAFARQIQKGRNKEERQFMKDANKDYRKYTHDPNSNLIRTPMRNAEDYKRRTEYGKSKCECTETIDTLDLIL